MNARAKVVSAVLLFAVAMWLTSSAGAQVGAPTPTDPLKAGVWNGDLIQSGTNNVAMDKPATEKYIYDHQRGRGQENVRGHTG